MAAFNVVFKSEEYRRCLVNSERALFHRWCEEDTLLINLNTIANPEITKAIRKEFQESLVLHGFGEVKTVSNVYALVEFENGLVEKVEPTNVKFVDGERLFKDYAL